MWRASPTLALLLLAAAASWGQDDGQGYVLGPKDVLSIVVMGHPEVSYTEREPITIRPDGMISFPLMSQVAAAGKTTAELEEQIAAALGQRFRHVEVAVNLVRPRERRVYVLGEVNLPGAYDLAHEDIGVREAIALAGGLRAEASRRNCYLYGRDVDPVRLDLTRILADPDNAGQPRLVPGDTLVVQRKSTVAVVGQVTTPGVYEMEDGARVTDAVAKAEGLTPRGDRRHALLLHADQTCADVDIEAALAEPQTDANPVLAPGDTLVVAEARNEVAVLGAVKTPGSFYAATELTASQAIALAGGPLPNADLGHVKLLRPGEDPRLLDLGPLVRPTRHEGLAPFAAAADPVQLAGGDALVVPERLERVIVLGHVSQPGAYGIEAGDRVTDVIAAAGGFIPRQARLDRVGLLRRDDDKVTVHTVNLAKIVKGQNQSGNLLVQDGDMVVVPGQRKLDWSYYASVLYGIGGFARYALDVLE